VKEAVPLLIGIEALIGAPFTVKPTEPATFDGKTVATSLTGVPKLKVGGADIEIVFPLGVAITESWMEVDAVDKLPPDGT